MSASWSAAEPDGPGVGSVGEEAARLMDAFTEALGRRPENASPEPGHDPHHGPHPGVGEGSDAGDHAGPPPWDGLGDLAAQAADAVRGLGDRVAPGAECRWCPLCRAVHLVRGTSPEVREHLMSAARSLIAAATVLLEQTDRDEAGRATPGVERIDLDPEPDPDPEPEPEPEPEPHDQHEEEHR